jgi:hypothetical protein
VGEALVEPGFLEFIEALSSLKYWWPNSWMTVSSLKKKLGDSRQPVPPVMKVGYSIPPAPMPPWGGSTRVMVRYG